MSTQSSFFARSMLVCVLPALLLFAPGCGDSAGGRGDDVAGNDTGSGVLDAVADMVLDGANADSSTSDIADTTQPTDSGQDTALPDSNPADVGEECTGGTLCGNPVACCPAGNECISGACLPTCSSGVRCGAGASICCGTGEVCIADTCAAPGAVCTDSYDCVQPGEFCEPTLGKCLPQPADVACTSVPQFDQIDVVVEWSFETDQIISPPFVADVNGDGVQEVVLNLAYQDGGTWPEGKIAVLNGKTGDELFRIDHDPANNQFGSYGRSSLAIGDVSGDAQPDIIYAGRDRGIYAVDGTGALLWYAHDGAGTQVFVDVVNGAATLANFDSDPMAEVVFGAMLIDNDGLVMWNQGGAGPSYGTNQGYTGGISAVADLTGDGKPEIVSGRDAWQVHWQAGVPPTATVQLLWSYPGPDGYPAVADLDGDTLPEVVLVGNAQVVALNGRTGELWCGRFMMDDGCVAKPALRTLPIAIPGGGASNRGGPPTIADFDGDGRPEVGVAGGFAYSVYDFNRPGEGIVQPPGDPTPGPGAAFVRWSQATQDQSSNATGSSVFDFQGDGTAEVVYADECYLRVYDGANGSVHLEVPNSSATIHEYPIVVDVDSDGNSEILIVANGTGTQCASWGGNPGPTAGLFVYGDVNDEWVPTRRVWPQHSYHVTNATSDGNVPAIEQDNWTLPGLNNYRQNVQGDGVFNAPDLAVDLSAGLTNCLSSELELRARVSNVGALGVPAGVEVTFYEGSDASGTVLGTASTAEPLLPGASTVVTLLVPAGMTAVDYYVVVDGGVSAGVISECNELNNDDAMTGATCNFN